MGTSYKQRYSVPLLLVICACPERGTELQPCEAASFAPQTPAAFCEDLERDLVASAVSCWGGHSGQWSGYAARVRPSCLGLVEGVRLGFLTYSATAAARCFQQYGCSGVVCSQSFASTRMVREGESCEVAPRESSTWVFSREGSPCAPGLYCGSLAGALTCKRQASFGENCEPIASACSAPWECLGPGPRTCKARLLSGLGERCSWPDNPCVDGAACSAGLCVPVLERGAPCSPTTSICELGYVCDLDTERCIDERRCGELPRVGGSCGPGECANVAYCGADRVCHVRPVAGEDCSRDPEGDDVICLEGSCRPTGVCE